MTNPAHIAPAHIAIVEDDAEIRSMLAEMLVEDRYRVSVLPDGSALDALIAQDPPDLLLLDVMLPGEDGLSICRRLAGQGGPRILMLTARGSDIDRIIGLEIGADDYLPKPFNPRELLARVRALLRRGGAAPATATAREYLDFGPWRADPAARSVTERAGGAELVLSSGEFDLLMVFLRNPARVLSRDQLLDDTRGRGASPFDRAIDVQMSKLRRKLGDDPALPRILKTVRGGGYMLALPVTRVRG